ncbi:hypothetical protein C2G38_2030771 [Gigaspora rosea]|uniref:F-box domain-containing protein n=1 Tax=Gigaspora rosea TaxID=44941 RepID=A0A397VV22_9GLOM|nr:hypothetical protein C2G38_2030771 [Gigaspora rosea]
MNSSFLIPEIWVEIFQYIASLKFYSLHNLLLVNRSFCSCVVPLLWTDPLEKARSDDDRYKIIDIYLSCLNKEEQIELDKLLIKNIVIKKQKELLFPYVNFLKIYSYYELKHVGVFMWCLKNDILSLKPQVFLLIHKMIVRVCRYIKELNISTNTFDAEWFVNLPRPWFPQSTITSLDISFGFFPYALNESISQLIRKAFQELKEIRVIKASFGNGINEDSKEAMQELIDTQSELKEFQLNYSMMLKEENLSKAFIILPTLHKNLYRLSLDAIIFTENDLKNIASLPNLKILKIENSSFEAKDKEIISTCSLTKLQKLKLKNNELVINKFLVSMKCETLKILSITLTNSQIEKNDVSNEFCSLINRNFPNLQRGDKKISTPKDLIYISKT